MWLTREQLGSPQYLNSMEHADAMIKTLPSKKHDNEVLADLGVLMYEYTHEVEEHNKINQQEARTDATAELTDKEYAEVTHDLQANNVCSNKASKPGKRKKEGQQESPVKEESQDCH